MEFDVPVAQLTKALSRVQGIVEKKTTMPILANVLIVAEKPDKLTLSATDLEVGLTGHDTANVKESGSITLGAKALYDVVRALPGERVNLKKIENERVEVRCGKVEYKIVGMPAEGFPSLPSFDALSFFPIDAKVFKEMIDKTLYAVSTDETRYNLTGVYCEAMENGAGLRMVSTDGHRLSLVERPVEGKAPMEEGVIIPRKGLTELRKLLDESAGVGQLAFVDTSAVFKRDDLVLTMRLIDGRFPDYQQVIPSSTTRHIKLKRQAFLSGLKRTSLLSPDKGQGVRLELTEGTLALLANNPDLGEAREEIEIDYEGESLKIGFNFRYIVDALASISEEEVQFELTDELSPGVVRGVGSEGYQAVVMPMRI